MQWKTGKFLQCIRFLHSLIWARKGKFHYWNCAVLCLVTQSCPTFCDPMDWSPPGSSVHGDSPGKYPGVGSHFLLQGILNQGLNPGLPHCRQILYHLSLQGSHIATNALVKRSEYKFLSSWYNLFLYSEEELHLKYTLNHWLSGVLPVYKLWLVFWLAWIIYFS